MLLRLVFVLVMLVPTVAGAETFFDETFDTGTLLSSGWVTDSCVYIDPGGSPWANGCNPSLSTDVAHSGTHSVKADYTGALYPDGGSGTSGVQVTRYFTSSADHWKRFWFYTVNGSYPGNNSKNIYDYTPDDTPSLVWEHRDGSRELMVGAQNIPSQLCPSGNTGATCNYPPNMASVPLNDGQWYCIETHVNLGTAGQADGSYEIFVNGVQTLGYYNKAILRAGEQDGIHRTKIIAQGGGGKFYYDDFAVGNTRIGCGSTPAQNDTVAPGQVTSLAATVSAGQVTLSWVNGSDLVGVIGQNILRCTGAACTPTATHRTMSGTNTAFVDTGLAASTVYGYKVNDFDAAGNQGAYSATVYATTPASSYRTVLATDDFARVDSVDLGTTWDAGYTATNKYQVVSGRARAFAADTDTLETYNGITTPNDQYITATLSLNSGLGTTYYPGLIVRAANAPTYSGYECQIDSATNVGIYERTAGARAALTTGTTSAWADADKIRCEAEGTAIRFYRIRAGVETLLLSTTDASNASGKVGIRNYAATSVADKDFDDVEIGSLSSTPPTPPAIATVDATATQATVTWGTPAPTTIRVFWEFGSLVTTLSEYVSGVYTFPNELKATLTNFVCFVARNASGTEVTGAQVCDAITASIDTAPPVVSNGLPNATLPVDTTSATVSVTVDKPASCRWDTTDAAETEAGFSALVNVMVTASFTASGTITGLTNNSTRNVYVRCAYTDVTGTLRPNLTSTVIVVAVAAATTDTTPPGTTTNLTATVLSQSQVALSWTAASGGAGAGGAIAYVGKTDCASTVSVSTVTCSVTVPACTDCLMVMATQIRDTSSTSPDSITSATFNSTESLTKIRHDQQLNGTSWRTELWYRLAPTVTTADLVVNWDGPPDQAIGVTVILLSGVSQSTPVDAQTGSSGTGTTASAAITTVAANAWIVDSVIGRDDAGLTVGAGQTARTNRTLEPGGVVEGAGVSTVDGKAVAGSETMDWTQASNDWVISTASFAPAGASDVAGYYVYLSVGEGSTDYYLAGTPVTTTQTVVNLTSATIHNFVVKAYDTSGNIAASYSNVATVTTASPTDIVPPSTMTNLRVMQTYTGSVLLSSDPGTDDKGPVTTTIEVSPAGCGAYVFVYSRLSLEALITNLAPGTSYCARGKFSDGTNLSTDYSNEVIFTTATGTRQLTRPRTSIPFGQPRLPRN